MPGPELNPVLTFTGELPDYLNQAPKVFAPLANKTVLQWNAVLLSYNASLADVNAALIYMDDQVAAAQQKVVDAGDAGAIQVSLAADQVALAADEKNQAIVVKDSAVVASNIALAVSNIMGYWSELTELTAIPAWSGIFHNSKFWINKVATSKHSSNEPLVADGLWIDYFSEVSAGEVVSSSSDTTGTKLPNVAWVVDRGIGGSKDLRGYVITTPNDIVNKGFLSGFHDGGTLGIPGFVEFAEASYGTLNIYGSFSSAAAAKSFCLTFFCAGKMYIKQAIDSTTWGEWRQIDKPDVIPPEQGGTGETTLEAARTAMSAAKSGLVTDSGLTMTLNRLAGRLGTDGLIQQLTAAQVKSLLSGRVADAEITSATARIAGRVASGTGSLEELTANQVMEFLGIYSASSGALSSGYVTSASVQCRKLQGFVICNILFTTSVSGVGAVNFSAELPAGFRPAGTLAGVVDNYMGSDKNLVVQIQTNGTLTFSRGTGNEVAATRQVTICYVSA